MSDWILVDDAADILCVAANTLRAQPYREQLRDVIRKRPEKRTAGRGRATTVWNREDCEALAAIRRKYRLTVLQAARVAAG